MKHETYYAEKEIPRMPRELESYINADGSRTTLLQCLKNALKEHTAIIVDTEHPQFVRPFVFAGKVPSLDEMQGAVGGLIEPCRQKALPGVVMIVDEEGLLKEKPVNMIGSALYREIGGTTPIVGDIILMPSKLFK